GATIDQGGTVNLTVSSGPSSVTVPALAGQTQVQAANALGQQGLNLGKVTSQASTQYAAGIVIASVPAEGTQVQPGSSVDIIVSSGPPPPTTTTTTPPTTTTTSTSTTSSSTSTTSSSPPPPLLP
ncbi:MAG: PASTA domain-containing protein, partial [Actinomycetota bacterium]|nr:PASTA domain-containing protein [Actinomycetota bacterium]